MERVQLVNSGVHRMVRVDCRCRGRQSFWVFRATAFYSWF